MHVHGHGVNCDPTLNIRVLGHADKQCHTRGTWNRNHDKETDIPRGRRMTRHGHDGQNKENFFTTCGTAWKNKSRARRSGQDAKELQTRMWILQQKVQNEKGDTDPHDLMCTCAWCDRRILWSWRCNRRVWQNWQQVVLGKMVRIWHPRVGTRSATGEGRLLRNDTIGMGKSDLSPTKEFYDDENAHRCEVCVCVCVCVCEKIQKKTRLKDPPNKDTDTTSSDKIDGSHKDHSRGCETQGREWPKCKTQISGWWRSSQSNPLTTKSKMTLDRLTWLVREIRARRLEWLSHILKMSPMRILTQTIEHMYNNKFRSEGDILTDTPKTQSWDELRTWVQDRKSGELVYYTQCGWDRRPRCPFRHYSYRNKNSTSQCHHRKFCFLFSLVSVSILLM